MKEKIDMGAEATISETTYLGYNAIMKTRVEKTYRHPELDRKLRIGRTKTEVKLIRESRSAGVRTPIIYDVDLEKGTIIMEKINGIKVKDLIEKEPNMRDEIYKKIGECLAKLHSSKICHGDLTTSNMIYSDTKELCFIDFSLGSNKCDIESMGVDIHLLERTFNSSHPSEKNGFEKILKSYCASMEKYKEVLKKVEDIKSRARYT